MSAFMISNGTMDKILEGIYTLAAEGYLSQLPCDGKTYDPKDCDSLTELGNDLFTMNAEAICQRYGEANRIAMLVGAEEYAFSFEFRPTVHVRCYKALQCFLYQCSEGTVPKSPLFGLMEDVRDAMAARIIRDLPEYESAAWDSPHRTTQLRKVLRIA